MQTRFRVYEQLGEHLAEEALTAFRKRSDGVAIGFCYRPTDARWFRLDSTGVAYGPDGEPLNLTGVFELRSFTAEQELRWQNVSAGRGPAILVSDGGQVAGDSQRLLWRLHNRPYERLLWGSVATSTNGWVTLHDARIGTLQVPIDDPVAPGDQVWLQAVEYVGEDEHGNLAVLDERLTGLVTRKRQVV